MEGLFTPAVLIMLAGGCFILAYLIINQLVLRGLMLAGSAFYVAYYATAAEMPLWGAIYTTLAMVTANLIGIVTLLARRSRLAIPADHADLYPRFDMLSPGDFRLILRHAERLVLEDDALITREGAPVTHLSYIISGAVQVTKRGHRFDLPDGLFVGEVAYLLDRPSVASTRIKAGSELLRWDLATVRRLAQRNPRFKLAIDAMLSRDLASKVSKAVAQQPALAPA
ncbi:MAG: cyclic nucleotide-binding domain-containing protein [Pseudomonadota bacterium]